MGVDGLPLSSSEPDADISESEIPPGITVEQAGDTVAAGNGHSDAVSTASGDLFVITEKEGKGLKLTREQKQAALDALREEHDAECPHCTVATAHTRTVFGEGNPDADMMFVGEAPGAEEDRQGRPFVGRSGQKLTQMIEALGLKREDVYIANVLKRRPPDNATPTASEAAKCGPYLERQIEIIQPRVIVTLGGPAAKLLLQTREGVTRLRGTWHSYRGIPVMPTFHPAYLLRRYTPENRKKVWSDLQAAFAKICEKTAE